MDKNDLIKIGNARDLADKTERRVYRLFEILPGLLAWATLLGVIFLSWASPVGIAFFIIAFDIYWLLKTIFLSLHLRSSWSRIKKIMAIDWLAKLKDEPAKNKWNDVYHLVVLPMYKENYSLVSATFESLLKINYPLDKLIVVLGVEERAGKEAAKVAQKIKEKYSRHFFKFMTTVHPADIAGELAGKGSNETWAGKRAKEQLIDKLGISYENILVSVFDVDSVFYSDYFARLTYVFLATPDRYHCSFQPVPIFNNNIWDAPSFSRVVAQSGTFWHMMQQERPERLSTFSSHSMSFKAIVEMNWWSTRNVSEDSRIFWQALLFYDCRYRAVPLHYPVSMDANLARSWWQTIINVYKQQRRWGWGVENVPYLLFGFWRNKAISFRDKVFWAFQQLEGFWSWATNALIIFMLGWMPLLLGGHKFNMTQLSYNLPQITRIIMTAAMVGVASSAIYGLLILPPRPAERKKGQYVLMVAQWILMPVTIIIFGALPGLEAQTRLIFGKYMGFWVTPKTRKK
jgi:hypothetical protein